MTVTRIATIALSAATVCALTGGGLSPAHAAETTVGNNLSVPLLWSEAAYPPPLTIRETDQFAGQVLPGHVVALDSTSEPCLGAVQQDAGNIWQAETALAEGSAVTTLDWGDNLESMDPNLSKSYTRVEVGLTRALDATATGYDMCWISGRGSSELWGAQVIGEPGSQTAVTSERTEAIVYTAGARLTIQRIVPGRDYSWDATKTRWTGTGSDAPYFTGALHEPSADGPGAFGAEITISGRLSYGYLWATNSIPTGEYRLTFSLDGPSDGFVGSGTTLSSANILGSSESTATSLELAPRAEGAGNTAVMRQDLNLSYIDVTVGVRTDPIPSDEPTNPPPAGGSSSGGSSSESPAPEPAVTAPVAPAGPEAVGAPTVIAPAFASALRPQYALIKARKAGTYRVGQTLLLASKPARTDAGVTVRWRVRTADRDECRIRVRDGRATVTLLKPGTCQVIAWAPAPSPQFAAFQWTRTYRVMR